MRVGVAADHAGAELRDAIARHVGGLGHEVVDYGGPSGPDDDYPLLVQPLAHAIRRGDVERGLFFCGSGIGPAVAANKIDGVRATVVTESWSARDAVTHVDVNLLTLGQRVIGIEVAKGIVEAFLGATAEGGRHQRRREQIEEIERGSGSSPHGGFASAGTPGTAGPSEPAGAERLAASEAKPSRRLLKKRRGVTP